MTEHPFLGMFPNFAIKNEFITSPPLLEEFDNIVIADINIVINHFRVCLTC